MTQPATQRLGYADLRQVAHDDQVANLAKLHERNQQFQQSLKTDQGVKNG